MNHICQWCGWEVKTYRGLLSHIGRIHNQSRHNLTGAQKVCKHCGKPLVRKIWSTGKPEKAVEFAKRKYCDRKCMGNGYSGMLHTPLMQWFCTETGFPSGGKDMLMHYHSMTGSWAKTAKRIGITKQTLTLWRKRLGMPVQEAHS